MRIAVAGDHNGFVLKGRLVAWLTGAGHTVEDLGSHTPEEVDYPELCVQLCTRVIAGTADRGIVLGGSGLGETIACNKLPGIRAGLCPDLWFTRISRGNNDSNVLVLPAKVLDGEYAEEIVETWLTTPFKGGVHRRRIDRIAALERRHD
ncbi:RpiB/LacA/LacB family sugar-phosphate isomerase [Streptomyces winkii]|uniref:RpiB/LacA/LacB family sugar-phosphate isomerase n=1 Tax=Streptomyces winkii TaxID=3051178 RepID=UPI0028D1B6A5|nr:RpiB/LacA/LacB family sugar-phosphate isomerase [Streptomyces sp. DSM 40971]